MALIAIETNPCADCDYAPAFCDRDMELCMLHGAPQKEEDRNMNIETDELRSLSEKQFLRL